VAAMGAAQYYTHVPGVAHWASIKQASALVREGDTHPPKEKEKEKERKETIPKMSLQSNHKTQLNFIKQT